RFRTAQAPIISPNAFEPRIGGRAPDTDGISLARAACLADPTELLATVSPERWHEFAIVRIPVALLSSLGLSVERKPDPQVKGHVVIPELNASDYAADKARFTPKKVGLAVEASKDQNIVKRPEPPTTG